MVRKSVISSLLALAAVGWLFDWGTPLSDRYTAYYAGCPAEVHQGLPPPPPSFAEPACEGHFGHDDFRVSLAGQFVVRRPAGSPLSPSDRFQSCVVWDRKNWSCLADDGRMYRVVGGDFTADPAIPERAYLSKPSWWLARAISLIVR